jgi:hypothetical protein
MLFNYRILLLGEKILGGGLMLIKSLLAPEESLERLLFSVVNSNLLSC